MHPCALPLILTCAAAGLAGAHGLPAAAGTPAARFWEQALPGSPMPESIARLVQKGIDRSPLSEPYAAASYFLPSACLGYHYGNPCRYAEAAEAAEAGEAVTGLFFHESQARAGAVMTVSFPPGAAQGILPRDVAEKVPFASADDVLAAFRIPPRSQEAAQVANTLRGCRAPPPAGETKVCATSLEATVRAATRMLLPPGGNGDDNDNGNGTAAAAPAPPVCDGGRSGRRVVVWAAASAMSGDSLPRRAYEVAAVTALDDGDRHVACHDEQFPYAVFQCHMAGRTRAYMVTLRGGGREIEMATLCHRDTSNWNPAHPAFEMLNTKPGGAPVCHFMPYANLVFGVKQVD